MEDDLEYDYTELTACVVGLGGNEEHGLGNVTYVKGEECIACLKDLLRMVRRDDPEYRHCLKKLGEMRIIEQDLLPLLTVYHQDDPDLVMSIVKLIAFLSFPPPEGSTEVLLQISYLRRAKEAFLKPAVLGVLMELLADPISNGENRTESDVEMIELILTVIRNLLRIPDPSPSSASAGFHRIHLQDELIVALYQALVLEVIVFITEKIDEASDVSQNMAFLVAEIIALLFRGQDVKALIKAHEAKPSNEADGSAAFSCDDAVRQEFLQLQSIEEKKKLSKAASMPRRHSRFKGTYRIEKELGQGASLSNSLKFSENQTGKKQGVPFKKNKSLLTEPKVISSMKTRSILFEYATQFLCTNCFNPLINLLSYHLMRDLNIQTADRINYYFIVSFFNRFAASQIGMRRKDDPLCIEMSSIASSLDMDFIHKSFESLEEFRTNKDWTGVSVTFRCIKDLVLSLEAMSSSRSSEEEKKFSIPMQNNLFYEPQLMETLSLLLREYKPWLQERLHLLDLVECVHVYLRLLDNMYKEKDGKMIVLRKKRKRKPKNQPNDAPDDPFADEGSENEEEDRVLLEERDYNIKSFVLDLVRADVIENYNILLGDFMSNPIGVNHQLASFFHRIISQGSSLPVFFRLSVLTSIHKILEAKPDLLPWVGPERNIRLKEYKQLVDICIFIVKKFFDFAARQPVIFVEPFFRHSRGDVKEILTYLGEDISTFEPPSARDKDVADPLEYPVLGRVESDDEEEEYVPGFFSDSDIEDDYIVPEIDPSLEIVLKPQIAQLLRQKKSQSVEWLLSHINSAISKKREHDGIRERSVQRESEIEKKNDDDDDDLDNILDGSDEEYIEMQSYRMRGVAAKRHLRLQGIRNVMESMGFLPPSRTRGHWIIPKQISEKYLVWCSDFIKASLNEDVTVRQKRRRPAVRESGSRTQPPKRQRVPVEAAPSTREDFEGDWRSQPASMMSIAELEKLMNEEEGEAAPEQRAENSEQLFDRLVQGDKEKVGRAEEDADQLIDSVLEGEGDKEESGNDSESSMDSE